MIEKIFNIYSVLSKIYIKNFQDCSNFISLLNPFLFFNNFMISETWQYRQSWESFSRTLLQELVHLQKLKLVVRLMFTPYPRLCSFWCLNQHIFDCRGVYYVTLWQIQLGLGQHFQLMYKESIQEPHHKHGMHSCLNRKFLLSTFIIDVQLPFQHKHHLVQVIVF